MRSRCSPFGYRPSGWKFDVVTIDTRLANIAREQAVQDHRVGDVGDMELVEADQPVAPRDAPAEFVERIGRALQVLQLAVHLAHELVEVQPRLARQRHATGRSSPSGSSCRARRRRACRRRAGSAGARAAWSRALLRRAL